MNRRKRVDRTGSAPKRRSATPDRHELRPCVECGTPCREVDLSTRHADGCPHQPPLWLEAIASAALANDGPKLFVQCPISADCMLDEDHVPGGEPCWLRGDANPLTSPQHKRALRESSRAAIKEVVAKWLALGSSPGDLADHLEGARVEMADEARKRGRQG